MRDCHGKHKASLAMTKANRGQAALLLVLLSAMALIFYAMTLNWGRTAQMKTQVTIAADSGASAMASGIASYGEKKLQEELGGRPMYCKSTSIWTAIATLVIAIIIVIISWGSAWYVVVVAVASVVLAAANLALQVLVVQPGLTSLWNKLQANLTQEDQYLEQGLSTAFQGAVSDNVNVPDYFDMDTDGLFKGNSNDEVSRFGIYYTERLKSLVPPSLNGIDDFRKGLQELSFGGTPNCANPQNANLPCCLASPQNCTDADFKFALFDAKCTGSDTSPECNAQCVPCYGDDLVSNPKYQENLARRNQRGGWTGAIANTAVECRQNSAALCLSPMIYPKIREGNCTADSVPAGCTSPYSPAYPFVYNPTAENETNAFVSFRESLGFDDEHRGYMKAQATPNGSQSLDATNAFRAQDATSYYTADTKKGMYPLLSGMLALNIAPINLAIDAVSSIDPSLVKVDANVCASQVSGNPGAFLWKQGMDNYCASIKPGPSGLAYWPYHTNCPKHAAVGSSCSDASDCDPCVSAPDKSLWVEDPLDAMVEGLGAFWLDAQEVLDMDLAALKTSFAQWYPRMAQYIAPRCTSTCLAGESFSCDTNVCYEEEGLMRQWRARLGGEPSSSNPDINNNPTGGWHKTVDDWLKAPRANSASWCLPSSVPANMPQDEKVAVYITDEANDKLTKLNACLAQTACAPGDVASNPCGTALGNLVLPAYSPVNDCNTGTSQIKASFKALVTTAINTVETTAANFVDPATVTVKEVNQCLNYNKTNAARFQSCIDACVDNGSPDYAACRQMPRSLVSGFQNLRPTGAAPGNKTASRCLYSCGASTCTPAVTGVTFNANMCDLNGRLKESDAGNAQQAVIYQQVLNQADAQFNGSVCQNFSGIIQSQKLATSQGVVMSDRHALLGDLERRAKDARSQFKAAYLRMNDFLTPCSANKTYCPAVQLMGARQQLAARASSFANFVIYGWQDSSNVGVGTTQPNAGGNWHIVRVEGFSTNRCGVNNDATRIGCHVGRFPWVKTKSKGFLGTKRCYWLEEHTGTEAIRVTRFDEQRGASAMVRFANQAALWKFRYTNPTVVASGDASTLLQTCGGVGLTSKTISNIFGLGNSYNLLGDSEITTPISGVSEEEKRKLVGAFMINWPLQGTRTAKEQDCMREVERLIVQGVSSHSCAEYTLQGNHVAPRFKDCGNYFDHPSTKGYTP